MSFTAETGSKHQIVMDGAPEAGGKTWEHARWNCFWPAPAGAAFDVVAILRKGRHDITGCEIAIQAERAQTDPKVFTRIHFDFRISGRNLRPEVVSRAIELSKEKYCSASIMLAKTAEITHRFEIIESA